MHCILIDSSDRLVAYLLIASASMSKSSEIREYLLTQFENKAAQSELKKISSAGFNWIERTRTTIIRVSELLPNIGETIRNELEAEFNSGTLLKQEYKKGEPLILNVQDQAPALKNWYDATGKVVASVRESGRIDSQQVSAGVQAILLSEKKLGTTFVINGGSSYPDLLWSDSSYKGLPPQLRGKPIDGPCMKGIKPSNVPDGLEIKTNRSKRIKVDAHGAHPGLHLGVTWGIEESLFKVTGVWIAYIKISDHRESGRNVDVTTVKFSFGHSHFMSVI